MGLLTQAQLIAEAPDGGLYTAAEYRNMLNDVIRGLVLAPYSLDNAEDIWWQGDAAGMTEVTVTGTQTITEKDGQLSVVFQGQSTSDTNALLKAHTFSVGDSFCIRLRWLTIDNDFTMVGLVFTDGTGSTANCMIAMPYTASGTLTMSWWTGTLTNVVTYSSILGGKYTSFNNGIYVKLTYTASNTFTAQFSADGISWTDFGLGAATKTMTPTHFGIIWSKWGGASSATANFGPLCKLS